MQTDTADKRRAELLKINAGTSKTQTPIVFGHVTQANIHRLLVGLLELLNFWGAVLFGVLGPPSTAAPV